MIRDQVYDLSDLVEHFLSDFRAIEEFFKDHAREISQLYAQGDASKGDIVEHVSTLTKNYEIAIRERVTLDFVP